MKTTRAKFAAAVEAAGGASTVAVDLGCTPEFVGQLISGAGDKRPSLDRALIIEQKYGITMQEWAYPPDKAKRARSRRRAARAAA